MSDAYVVASGATPAVTKNGSGMAGSPFADFETAVNAIQADASFMSSVQLLDGVHDLAGSTSGIFGSVGVTLTKPLRWLGDTETAGVPNAKVDATTGGGFAKTTFYFEASSAGSSITSIYFDGPTGGGFDMGLIIGNCNIDMTDVEVHGGVLAGIFCEAAYTKVSLEPRRAWNRVLIADFTGTSGLYQISGGNLDINDLEVKGTAFGSIFIEPFFGGALILTQHESTIYKDVRFNNLIVDNEGGASGFGVSLLMLGEDSPSVMEDVVFSGGAFKNNTNFFGTVSVTSRGLAQGIEFNGGLIESATAGIELLASSTGLVTDCVIQDYTFDTNHLGADSIAPLVLLASNGGPTTQCKVGVNDYTASGYPGGAFADAALGAQGGTSRNFGVVPQGKLPGAAPVSQYVYDAGVKNQFVGSTVLPPNAAMATAAAASEERFAVAAAQVDLPGLRKLIP